jgi:hypothetical protein
MHQAHPRLFQQNRSKLAVPDFARRTTRLDGKPTLAEAMVTGANAPLPDLTLAN